MWDGFIEWLRQRRRQPKVPPVVMTPDNIELTPMQRYAQEFMAACDRTERLGMALSPLRLVVNKDCVDLSTLAPVLQFYFGRYRQEEMVGQAFAINTSLIPLLLDKVGIPFTLTMGWFDDHGKRPYEHGEELIEKLLKRESDTALMQGLPLHVWLTSPAFEVLDVTLPTTLAQVSQNPKLAGGILYLSNQNPAPEILYHPTIMGEEFLVKIGAAI